MERLPLEYVEQIPSWDFTQLWKMFELLQPELEILNKVKNGIKLKFPVDIILYNKFEEFPRVNLIRVLGHGLVDYYKFTEEIRLREKEMREFILESYEDDTTSARV